METLFAAVDEGAVSVSLPAFVRNELSAYLECGRLCRGFARLRCVACAESRVVAFSCKGRGFCPSCLGRKMSATAANIAEHVTRRAPLRQWVITMPFAWRARLEYDGKLLSALLRIFTRTVLAFYKERPERAPRVRVRHRARSARPPDSDRMGLSCTHAPSSSSSAWASMAFL